MAQWVDSALAVGITEAQFYSMTIPEANRQILATAKRLRAERQAQAQLDYIQAQLTALFVARCFGAKDAPPTFDQAYKGLIDEESETERKANQAQADAEAHNALMEARFIAFAQRHNDALKAKEENPNG